MCGVGEGAAKPFLHPVSLSLDQVGLGLPCKTMALCSKTSSFEKVSIRKEEKRDRGSLAGGCGRAPSLKGWPVCLANYKEAGGRLREEVEGCGEAFFFQRSNA